MTAASIPFEQLVDLVEERLPIEERQALLTLAATQSQDLATIAWLERVLGRMRDDATENADAPAALVARAVQLFAPRIALPAPRLRERVLAALRFDSMLQPLALGVRAGRAATRQVLFNANDWDIDLRISRSGTQWVVAGQVLGPGEGGTVELQGPLFAVRTTMNDLWEFTLPPVPPGEYNLMLTLKDTEITTPSLRVGDV